MVSKDQAIAELKRRRTGGVTREQAVAELEKRRGAQQAPEPQEGLARTALEQGLQGATFGFADEAANVIGAGIASAATDESFTSLLQEARQGTSERLTRQVEQNPKTAIGSQLAGAVGTGIVGAGTKVGGALTKLITSGSVPTKVAASIGTGAVAGGVTGAGIAEEGQRLEGAAEGAAFGAATGAALPAVTGAVKAAGRAIVPQIDEATKVLARRAKDFGIPLRTDQIAPTKVRKSVQKIGQELPLSGTDAFEDTQRKAFTKAVAKTIGQEADDLSPETIKQFKVNAKSKFDDVFKGKEIAINQDVVQKVSSIKASVREVISEDLAKVVDTNVDIALKDLKAGTLSAGKLSSLRSRLIDNASSAKGGVGEFIGNIVDTIDDAAALNLSPEEVAKLAVARREWRNFKTIQPLLEKATEGQINPTQLINRVASSKFITASSKATGEDELVDLARIGKQFLPKSGGSDTFQKAALTGAGVASIADPTIALTTGSVLAGNRAIQALGRSQKVIDVATKATKGTKKAGKTALTGLVAAQSQQKSRKKDRGNK